MIVHNKTASETSMNYNKVGIEFEELNKEYMKQLEISKERAEKIKKLEYQLNETQRKLSELEVGNSKIKRNRTSQ